MIKIKNNINSLLVKRLLVTQKAFDAENKLNKLTLISDVVVTKFDIIAFFTALSISISRVNSLNIKGENRVVRGHKTKTAAYKKFIITFGKGENVSKIVESITNLQLAANRV